MADVTLGYAPVDGDLLNVDGLNGDLYDTTPSVSLYETANGHIELANFASGFRVQSYHIQPGETGDGSFIGQLFSADYFQDAWGTGEVYRPVAGACITVRTRYDVNLAIAFASLFCTTWRSPGPLSAGAGTWTTAPDALVRMFVDGSEVLATTRPLPQTVFFNGGAYPVVDIQTTEKHTTRHFNLHVPRVAGGTSPHAPLTAGEHTIGMAIYVAFNTEGSDTTDNNDSKDPTINSGGNDARPRAWYAAMHRVRCYVRNAGFVAFR